eukprot:jgi/Mesvir1/16113/Mv08399-RA.1
MADVARNPAPQRNPLQSFTRLTKGLSALLCIGFVAGQVIPGSDMYLALVPGKTIPCVWNLVSSGYFEQHFLSLVVNCVALLVLGRVLEPLWGSRALLKFIVIVNVSMASATFAVMTFMFFLTRHEMFIYGKFSGFHGVVAGMLVGLKQLMPEHEITLLFALKLRMKNVPSLFMVASVIIAMAGGASTGLPFIFFGAYFAWLYLRFFQTRDNNVQGDRSEEFAFYTFFPEFLHPFMSKVGTVSFNLCCGMMNSRKNTLSHTLPLTGVESREAARRRERGVRVLEERLGSVDSATVVAVQESPVPPLKPFSKPSDDSVDQSPA